MASSMTDLSEDMNQALNAKAQEEFIASHTYMAASFWFEQRDFEGIARWCLKEAGSEREHGLKFLDYIHKRGGKGVVMAIPAIDDAKWDNAVSVFNDLLAAEDQVTQSCKALMKQAREEGDYQTEVMLHEFIIEQTNAVDEVGRLVSKVKAYNALPGLLWHLDAELG